MVGQLALGYSCCLIASVAYAVNYLPVKKYDTGDGVFFTFAMSVGILMVGILTGVFLNSEPFNFEPLAALGGVIFTMGNLLCPAVIQLIGLGLGLTIWDLSNMLMGWVTGRFGLFGVEMEISQTPWMNYSGLALACVSLIFMYLAARYDCVKTTKEVEPVEADVEAPAEGDKENPLRLVLGSAMAVLAGVLFGTMFDLPQDLMQGRFGPCHSRCALDYVFSHFLGIFVASGVALLIYVGVQRQQSFLPCQIVLPAMLSGIIWAIGTVAWFDANGELGFSVTFPIISSLPSILALLIGFLFFDELNTSKNEDVPSQSADERARRDARRAARRAQAEVTSPEPDQESEGEEDEPSLALVVVRAARPILRSVQWLANRVLGEKKTNLGYASQFSYDHLSGQWVLPRPTNAAPEEESASSTEEHTWSLPETQGPPMRRDAQLFFSLGTSNETFSRSACSCL
eukprot:g24231.t1